MAPFARPAREPVGPGQESVWDYPRPPRVESVAATLEVVLGGISIARTQRGSRVLETAGAPVYYFPPEDVDAGALSPTERRSSCEWKGEAVYADVAAGGRCAQAGAWSYPDPSDAFAVIAGHWAFYCAPMDACLVDGERARPQPGGFYGGWVTDAIRGPIKGVPGSAGW